MSTKITTPELVEQIKEDFDAVYDAGYEKGKAEGGGDNYYDTFWDNYQDNGEKTDYRYTFAGYGWSNKTFKPKYSLSNIKFTNVIGMFQYSNITKVDYDLDFSRATGTAANYAFTNSLTKTIKLITLPKADNTTVFSSAKSLTSIRINGTTEYNFAFVDSPLDKASIESIIESLSDVTTGKTCALKKAAVNAAFTTEEWEALTKTKENWTFTLK